MGDLDSIPELGKSPGEVNWLPTPVLRPGEFHGMCIVHGVANSQTGLNDFHFHDFIVPYQII